MEAFERPGYNERPLNASVFLFYIFVCSRIYSPASNSSLSARVSLPLR